MARVKPVSYTHLDVYKRQGWHGSAMTAGQAIGAPLAGYAIDHAGWGWGFISVSLFGLAIAVSGGVGEQLRRRHLSTRATVATDA